MIEYSILFALGFLAATLLMLMLAPAIQKRIVAYTEKRLYATMPFSPTEVRAQKDMARALYAAENARIRQELEDERQRSINLRVRHDDEEVFHRALETSTQELQSQVSTLETKVTDLQNHLETKQKENAALADKLMLSEEAAATRAQEITLLTGKVKQIARELDEVKIQLASRAIEVEHEKSRAQAFKSERDTANKKLITAEAQNKDVAEKVTRESRRATLLEQRLADRAVNDADTAELLERRANEVARLKERLRAATTHVSGKGSGALVADEAYAKAQSSKALDDMTQDETAPTGAELDSAIADIASRSAHLSQRLRDPSNEADDGALREELAGLAADMVALTARREGASSPILKILRDIDNNEPTTSLASRAARSISAQMS